MIPLAQPPRKDDNRFDDWVFLLWKRVVSPEWTDLTDGGDTTLHYHATDRALANATGQLTLDHLATMKAFAAAQG